MKYESTTLTCLRFDSVIIREGNWYFSLRVGLELPSSWQLQLSICKLVEEDYQVPVMLVPLEVPGITANLQDHVFDTAAAGEHPIGCLQHRAHADTHRTKFLCVCVCSDTHIVIV